jgi:hypothetical protein
MRDSIGKLPAVLAAVGLLGILSHSANAAVQITDTVGTSGKFLVTGMPVSGPAPAVVKLVFGNLTSGTNLELCAGSSADFSSGACPIRLSSSGGPGFNFLTIVDLAQLNGKILYVKRVVGTAASKFSLTVD